MRCRWYCGGRGGYGGVAGGDVHRVCVCVGGVCVDVVDCCGSVCIAVGVCCVVGVYVVDEVVIHVVVCVRGVDVVCTVNYGNNVVVVAITSVVSVAGVVVAAADVRVNAGVVGRVAICVDVVGVVDVCVCWL